jgi:hypothetical protein
LFSGERSFEISKKIRKRTNFEILIFKIRFKFKKRRRRFTEETKYLDSKVRDRNQNSEVIFFKKSFNFKKWNEILYIISIEIGKLIYLEKNFLFAAKSSYMLLLNSSSKSPVESEYRIIEEGYKMKITDMNKFKVRIENQDTINSRNFNYKKEVSSLDNRCIIKKGCLFLRKTSLEAEKSNFSKVWAHLKPMKFSRDSLVVQELAHNSMLIFRAISISFLKELIMTLLNEM